MPNKSGSAEEALARSVTEGRQVQQMAERVLNGAGFDIVDRNKVVADTGATVNFVATDQSENEWMFDVSGAFTSKRAGLIRTDTLWKSLGRASVLSAAGHDRLILLTTNLPKRGSVGVTAMRAAALTFFDAVEMLTPEGKQRLAEYGAGLRQLPLPGFRAAEMLYPHLVKSQTQLGLQVAVPIVELGNTLPTRRGDYDVATMPYRLKLFIPSKDSDGDDIDHDRWRVAANRLVESLSNYAGGCTGIEAVGAWVDPIGGVMHETIHTVEAFAAQPFPDSLMREVLQILTGDLEQHTAALVVDESMLLITPREHS